MYFPFLNAHIINRIFKEKVKRVFAWISADTRIKTYLINRKLKMDVSTNKKAIFNEGAYLTCICQSSTRPSIAYNLNNIMYVPCTMWPLISFHNSMFSQKGKCVMINTFADLLIRHRNTWYVLIQSNCSLHLYTCTVMHT